jgi:hypothetical protein
VYLLVAEMAAEKVSWMADSLVVVMATYIRKKLKLI